MSTTQTLPFFRLRSAIPTVVAAFVIAGCGEGDDRPARIPATGQVLYQGKPVEGAHVAFRGSGDQTPAVGTTDAEGKFTLSTFDQEDGAIPGEYAVTVSKIVTVGGTGGDTSMEAMAAKSDKNAPQSRNELPQQYADPAQTPLKASVTEGGENHFVFKLGD